MTGGMKRNFPTGGEAYGIPEKDGAWFRGEEMAGSRKDSTIRSKEEAKMKGIKINAFKLNGSENEMTVLFGIRGRKTVITAGAGKRAESEREKKEERE